jgi:hypothetical protein
MRANRDRYAQSFEIEDDEDSDARSGPAEASAPEDEPDYSFEGFSVEFLDKGVLLPVTRPVSTPKPKVR